jgi:CRISPR/Cas system CMR subunit Cmr4 (Cas7 group RAMP superfamily)
MAKPKAMSKKMGPTDLVEEEEKAEAKVEAESGPKKEEENLGKASPKVISDTHLLLFPIRQRSLWKMKSSVTSWK